MPDKMKCAAPSKIMPAACQDAEGVAYDGTEYNARHAHVFGEDDGAQDVAAYLEYITDVVAKFIAVAVDHLLEIEDDYG